MNKQGFGQQLKPHEFTMLRKKQHSGFNAAYKLYADYVYSLSLHIVCDEEQAADILQQVFEKLLVKSSSIKQKETLGAWLKTCTINECTEYFRRLRKAQGYQLEASLNELESETLEVQHQQVLEQEKTAKLINELPVTQRSIVYLHAVQNLKHREIAKSVGAQEDSIRQTYRRALNTLKKWLTR